MLRYGFFLEVNILSISEVNDHLLNFSTYKMCRYSLDLCELIFVQQTILIKLFIASYTYVDKVCMSKLMAENVWLSLHTFFLEEVRYADLHGCQ